MRFNLEHSIARQLSLVSTLLGVEAQALTGNLVLTPEAPVFFSLDPNGANRTVQLPEAQRGRLFIFHHAGIDNTLTIQDASSATVVVVRAGEVQLVVCNGSVWGATSDVFGPAGVGHSTGLVPDPGVVSGLVRFLCDDGQWRSVTTVGTVDAYKYVTDGSNTAQAAGLSQFKIRSEDLSLSVVVTEADAIHGDNVNLQVQESNVDHDALANFVADEHINHASVVISAGSGLSGGGDITVSRTLALNVDNLSTVAPALTDTFPFYDVSGAVTAKATLSTLNATLDHDSFSGFVANEHVDHSLIAIQAGVGLSGGGDLTQTRTLHVDFTKFETGEAIAAGDLVPFYDISEGDHNTTSLTAFNQALDHDALLNVSTNKHIDHSAVSVTGTDGLGGGGNLTTSRTLNLAFNSLDTTTLDTDADYLAFWDASASGHRKSLFKNLPAFTGDSGSGGKAGLVPAPATGDSSKFLKGDGTWGVPSGASAGLRTGTLTIANDAAATIAVPGSGTRYNMLLVWSTFATTGYLNGLIFCRTGTSPTAPTAVALHDPSSYFASTTGALSGTTGADGKVTFSTHTDGYIYVENRVGATRVFHYQLFSSAS